MFEPKKYKKDESFDPFFKEINWLFFLRLRVLPISLMFLGATVFISQVILPLYYFKTMDTVARPVTNSVLGLATGYGDFSFNELEQNGQVKGTGTEDTGSGNVPPHYYLTIPRLGIKNALVETSPQNLDPQEALGHYPGTAYPGSVGNSFVYGHSVLPWFYNPKNYKTIFSTLGDLRTGDELYVKYNNKSYLYKVEGQAVETPDKVDPRAEYKPKYLNESTITLMTCWPAGTKSKRLLVYAVMVD
jgi:LPXTG-site transpeptidase (sortase) family protein